MTMTRTTMTSTAAAPLSRPALHRAARRLSSAVITLLIVALVVGLWPARLGGVTRWVIVSGTSMEPTYDLGDLVLTRDGGSPGVGDVVVFAVPEGLGAGSLVIHRIVALRADGSFVTQGDNRDTVDEWTLGPDDMVGRPVLHIPGAGSVLSGLGSGTMLAPLLGVAATLLLWPRRRQSGDERARPVGHRWTPAVSPDDMAAAERWLDEELRRLRCEGLADEPLPVRPLPERTRPAPRRRSPAVH